jgi:hypothetical protein
MAPPLLYRVNSDAVMSITRGKDLSQPSRKNIKRLFDENMKDLYVECILTVLAPTHPDAIPPPAVTSNRKTVTMPKRRMLIYSATTKVMSQLCCFL